MSILKKPYIISVWDDIWNSETENFEERRVGIIGADNMLYQGRAIEPNLVRNVNGTKKFSFKMYKYFVDNETGERVENPFIGWLVSERKVKLQYNGKWYDFIVKNVNENSSNYLYTYQLEDALVQELSKNGFGITLDAQLMNNMGTAGELANYVLSETDWDVSSEALVEKVEDNLVYITIPKDTVVHKIIDQTDLNNGIDDSTVLTLDAQWKALAFYTSCTNKPHRFQFIYIPEDYYEEDNEGKHIPSVSTDENQIINVKDCQYYCEINTPEAKGVYVQDEVFKQFYLPKDFSIVGFDEDDISNNHDTTISVWYRGYRYGFAQEAKYIPALDRYCNIYTKNDKKYYGYVDNDYNSPTLLQNIITNTDFKGTAGWVGAYSGDTPNVKSTYGAIVEPVYGRFKNSNFSSVIDELSNGTYKSDNKYETYLKVMFPAHGSVDKTLLLNTGFYDNRTLIGEVDYDEEWCFEPTILTSQGTKIENPYAAFDFKLCEVAFNPKTGAYNLGKIWAETIEDDSGNIIPNKLRFNSAPLKNEDGNVIESDTHANVKVSKKDFKKKEIKLVITPKTGKDNQTYYIKDMQLFKLMLNDKAEVIKPGNLKVEGVIKTTHRFFLASEVEEKDGNIKQEPIDVEAIKYENLDKTEIDYSVYVPQYNKGAQKVRSVDAKESNYFNILQSIAEKFEAWLELEIGRNAQGGIISKTVKFKNYAGKDNYASFRYGVNLKDIQRTYESKNIVTKLIVKQNSNEHAENGFCTIARAGANQTGENHIYDFRYYHDRDMLDKTEYVASLYYSKNMYTELVEAGPDVYEGSEYNLQNYFNRIKNLNVKIQDINDIIIPEQNGLVKLKADLAVQEGLRDAAAEGLEEVREDFQALTGVTPETIKNSGVDTSPSSIQSMLTEYATYMAQYNDANKKIEGYTENDGNIIKGLAEEVKQKEIEIKNKQEEIKALTKHKKELNKLFYSRYSRFIQEGTWIDEKYIDDNKYYADAQSVMYNSCYPQVAYTINVLALSALPGYELFEFELGDKTYAIDPEFFDEERQEAVIIHELSENLDDPSRDQIKVQNFKNQFQDLFQKITATVQQTQYSSGSYEKAVALAEASAAIKSEFLQDAFNSAGDALSKAGQTSVVWGDNGITLTDSNTKNEMRLIGGAILMSVQDENGQRKWKTGLTPEGISASLITAGIVDTGKVQIKNGKDITFLWNSFGISAFDVDWNNGEVVGTPDTSKFVRFDKHGIYGMDIHNHEMKDGMSWKPEEGTNINELATFALTWEGLKVTGNEGVVARIGKIDNNIINITKDDKSIFRVGNDGESEIAGWTISNQTGYSGGFYHDIKRGSDEGYRVGFKIEENTPERYAFYVTSYKEGDNPDNGQVLFGVRYDGEVVATKGKIGKLDIASIPESGYMALSVNNNFSWRFSPTEGMFMYNGDNEDGQGEEVFKIHQPILENGKKGPFTAWIKGTIVAESGNIGPIKIEEIPDDGYVASSVVDNFSWKFSPTDGMFMWNGGVPQAPDNEKTKDAIFSIYNDGTPDEPDFKLSMKGHVDADSGNIGDWEIKEGVLSTKNAFFSTSLSNQDLRQMGSDSVFMISYGSPTLYMGDGHSFGYNNVQTPADAYAHCNWSLHFSPPGIGGGGYPSDMIFELNKSKTVSITCGYYGEGYWSNVGYIQFENEGKGNIDIICYGTLGLGTVASVVNLGYKNGSVKIKGTDYSSDVRVKNSIETLPMQYEAFFDKMETVRYKYNAGTSGRYHTGFIAQQLETALIESGLTTQDFAGMWLDAPGTEEECWYLRRDEFVALNTWQIQKLKPRVSTLEQAIIDYETRISVLETEIQNLKSS